MNVRVLNGNTSVYSFLLLMNIDDNLKMMIPLKEIFTIVSHSFVLVIVLVCELCCMLTISVILSPQVCNDYEAAN